MRPESPVPSAAVDPVPGPVAEAGIQEALGEPPPQSRRTLLAGALGGLAGAVAAALGRPAETRAAAGSPLILGQNNFAGNSATRLSATSSGGAFWMTQNGSGSGVRGESWNGTGGVFQTHHADRHGLLAQQMGSVGSGVAVRAEGGSNTGVYGSSADYYGVLGLSTGSYGVVGQGVYGVHGTGTSVGVYGSSASYAGYFSGHLYASGVVSSAGGVYGQGTSGYGVTGYSSGTLGVYGESGGAFTAGVYGYSPYIGVQGVSSGSDANRQAVRGENGGSGTGYAGFFNGNAWVYGTLTKNAGSFRIDHPLDPARKYLQHSFVESPDMMNVYAGVSTLDASGEAVVELPTWFEALNKEVRYQLTSIGRPAPNLHVSKEVKNNIFRIAGGEAGGKVSWQVTGVRQDAWANAHRIEVELEKTGNERGTYLAPIEHGKPMSMAAPIRRVEKAKRTRREHVEPDLGQRPD